MAGQAGLSTGTPIVQVYHEKSRVLPDVSRVLACLYEKGIKFDTRTASYKSLLKLQASTHAPVPFYDGPTFLEESREICRYISEKYEHHGYRFLLGKDTLERVSVEQWLHNEEHSFNRPSRALFCHLAFPPDNGDNVDDIEMHQRNLAEVLDVYEQRLSDSEFLAGNLFTLADLVHLPNSHYITSSEFVYLYDSRKNVRRWWDAISKRGSWQQVLMYMKEVEEQERKEHQQQKDHPSPRTAGYPLGIYPRKHAITEPRRVLMHPPGTVSSSPIAPHTGKPLPIDIPDEPLVSSNQSTPTDHKTSIAKSKETPFQERPYTDHRRDVSSPLPLQTGGARGIALDDKASSDQGSALLASSKHIVSSRKAEDKEPHGTSPPQAGYAGGQDTNKQLRDPGSTARQTAVQSTFGESKAIYSGGSSDAFQSPHPRHDLDAVRHTTAPFQKRYPLTEDTTKQTKDITSTPWQMPDQETEDTENTTKETQNPVSSSSLVAGTPSKKHRTTEGLVLEKETTEDHDGATSQIHKRQSNIKDMAGQYRDVAFKPKKMISQDDGDALKETKFGDPSLLREQPSDTWQAATTTDDKTNQDGLNMSFPPQRTHTIDPSVTASRTRYPIVKDPSKQPRGIPIPRHKAAQDENDTSEGSTISDKVASSEQPLNDRRAPISPRRQEVEDSPREITSFQRRDPYNEDTQLADTREMINKTQSTAHKAHPIYSQGSIKVEKTPFLHKTPQTSPGGGKGDDSTLEHEEVSNTPYNDEKLSAAAPARARSHNGFNVEESHKKGTTDDNKVVSPLRSKEQTSQVQPPSVPSRDADPHEYVSSQESSIKPWQCASVPLNDMTSSSRDVMDMPTIDQKQTPSSQQGSRSGHGANHMAKEPGEQRVEAPILPIEPETSGAQSTSTFPEVATYDHASVVDGSSKAKAAHAERKSTLSDQKSAPFAQPLSPVEPVNIYSNDSEADDTMAPQMAFQQQARPSAPIIRGVPTSDRQSVTGKIQEATSDSHHTEDSGRPPVPSQKDQISQASQAIYHQEDMKYSPSTRDSLKSDIQPPSAQVHELAYDDQKVVSPLRSKEPTSQVQPPSVPSRDADPHGDVSTQQSSIKQWQRASVPLNDMTSNSRDAMDMPTVDQKPTPRSQQGSRSSHVANQMAEEPGEQSVEPPILPIEPQTPGVQSISSFPEIATQDNAFVDDKFAKQSIIDEKLEGPNQMQAPRTDARPASPPTNRKTPKGHETGDLEHAGSPEGQIPAAAKVTPLGPATTREDSHDAAIGEKTAKYGATGDQLVTRSLEEQARPAAPTHEAKDPIGGRRASKEPQLHGNSKTEAARAERKSTLSDQKSARFGQPLSPAEPVNIESNDYEADDTMVPQMAFQQQARPSAPIIRGVPTSDRQSVTGKIQEATSDSHHTEDSGRPPVPSQKDQTSHASQAIPPPEYMKYSPSSRDSPKSDIQPPLAQVHEVAYDDQKVVSPLRSKEPTSQVQPPSVPSRDADPHGDVSTQHSSIKQWQRASVPLNDMTSSSRDAMDMPTVDQKPTPRSQRGSRSSHGANQMAEEPGEQSVEPPILPIEPQTPGVQSISSFPEIATQDNAFVDDKFAKQSIIDEKLEGPNQMQAPRTDARPASPPTNRKTPKGHETGDLEHAGSPEGQITAAAKVTPLGPATTHEDSHDAAIGEKTAKYDATGDQLVTRSLEEQARLPAPTHEAKDPIGGRRVSKEPQLRGNSKTEAARAERKSTLSDQKPARFAQPLSPVEPVNIDSNDYEADDTMAPQMAFQQQARPSARIIREVPTSDRQSVTRNIQEATPYSHHTEDSERPPFLSKKDQISQASQAIPPPEFMKYSPSAKDSPKLDIQPPLAKDHKVSHDDRKLVSPRWSKEPTSQVQPPSVPSQDADPFGDPSSQQSSIKQWQRASVPLNDMTNSSRDATDMPTIDQKPTPPRGSHSGHGGNQIDKEGGEQRVEAPILPIEHDISGVQSTSPAFPATTDHAAIDGKFAKQSITAEKLGEPKQTQASIADARPASPSTNRKIPDGVETGGLEQASSSDGQISDAAKAIPPGPATIYEDSHDAVIDKKTTKHGSSGDQLITGPLQEQAHPPAPTRGAMEPIGSRRTSKEPQLHGSSQAEVVDAERKSIMSDQKPARAAQPLSPVEPVNIDNKVYGAYDTIAPQMTFRQQARPLAPITKAVPASEFQSVKRKIQEVTPNYHHIEDSGKPLVPSQEDQISHAPQESPPQEDLKYSPSSRDSPKSDIQPPLVQDHEVAHDDQKLVSPLRSKKPTYQGQPPSGPSQDAAPPEDLSNKLSTVEQWQRASVPLANQMAKESGEQRKETPILPIESEASGVQSTSPSFPEAVTTHHAIIDDKFAKQSNIDERLGERIQMRAPITDSLPTSPPIKRKAPDGPETGDLVPASSSQGQSDAAKATPPGPATIREDYHDAATDEKTTKYDASGDQLVTGSLHEQARPHAPTHEATEPIHGRQTSKEPQLRGSSQDEVAHDEQKSILSDQKAARSAQPLSPDTKYSPSARDFPKSDIKPPSAQIHEVTRDESSEQQGSHVEAFRPNELGSTEKKIIPSDQGVRHSADEPSSAAPWKEDLVAPIAKQIKALPGVTGQRGTPETREFPTSEDALDDISTNVDVHPTASTKAPRRSFSVEPTSSAQASPFHVAHGSLHTGTTPDDALGNAVSKKPSATPDDEHGIAPGNTTDEVAPAEHKFVPSGPDSVHSKRSPPSTVHWNEVTGDSTPETQQIFSMMQRKGDIAAPDQAKGIRKTLEQEDMLSAPLRPVSPSLDTQRPSEKAQEHIPADDFKAVSKPPSDIREVRQPTVVPASAPAARHGAATDEEVLDKKKFVPSGQDSVRSTLPFSSLEQRNGRIGDSSTKPKKGDIASTPDQAKDSEITLRGQDILPPARSVSPSSDIQRPSGKVHDVPTNDLGEAKPIVKALAPDTQYVDAQDEATPDEKKFAPPEPTSSTEPRKEEIRDSAPSKQLIFSTEKMKKNATISAPDQGKGLQTTLDQQDIPSEPVKLPSPPSDTHHQSKKAQENAPADDLGETTPELSALDREVRPSTVVPRSAPVTQYGAARDEALDKQKSIPSGQDSVHSALLRNGEIGDPAPSTQQIGDAAASIPKQTTDAQMTPSQQDILPPVRLESLSSDIQRPSGKVHEDAPADDVREAESILQASARDTQDENIVPSEPTPSTESRNKDIRDSAPSAQVISSTGTRNEDAIIAAPDQDKELQTTLDQEDILSAPVRSASPSSDTQHPSEKSPEDVLGNDLREIALKPLASGPVRLPGAGPDETPHDEQKIVPSGQDSVQSVQPSFSSEQIKEDSIVTSADQTEDSQTIMYRRNVTPSVDTSKTPLPDTKDASRKILESTSDDIDIDGSIPGGEQVPLGPDEEHATEPYRTAVDEKTTISPSSKAYNSESESNLTQARTDVHSSIGERPTETSFPGHGLQTKPPLTTQDISLGSSNKAKSAGEEAKEPIASASETQPDSTQPQDEAASAEQNFAVSGNQDTRQRPDAREASSKSQESPRDDDGISNLVDPLVRQEQASRVERASEGPVSEMQSANADDKTTLPSSQAQTSNTGPDSTLATGDAHLTNADMPATNSLQNQEAQPLAATQAPITQAPPASSQNVHHADSLENTETPIQPSRALPAPVTSSAAYSDTPNGEPGTATFQTAQGASFDLLGGEKTTTTQGDQVNPLLNGDLSTSQPVRPSESAGFKGTNSLQKLEGSSTNEKSKAQHQTDRSEISSSKDNNKEANKAIRSDLRPKENMKSTRELEHQEQADQAIVQSPDGNRKQIEQTKTHDTETGELEEMDPQENANQTNNKVSPVGALDSSGEQAPGVQLRGENIKYTSNSADDAPGDIQTRSNSEDNLTSYEGAKVQQQPKGNTVDGETGAPLSDTVQQNGRGLPENSYQNNSSQSQAEASDKSAGKFSPGIQNKNKNSSGLDSPTDGIKSGDAEDKSG